MPGSLTGALLPFLALAVPVQAQTAAPHSGEHASIPFVTHDSVRTFQSTPNGDGVYIQDNSRHWYYARFFTRCLNLPYAVAVGFKTFGGSSSLDRGDTIIADHERCRIADIVHSGPPPEKKKMHKHKASRPS